MDKFNCEKQNDIERIVIDKIKSIEMIMMEVFLQMDKLKKLMIDYSFDDDFDGGFNGNPGGNNTNKLKINTSKSQKVLEVHEKRDKRGIRFEYYD